MAHGAREVRVHREPQPAPVERAAEPAQLREDRVAGLAPPGPDPLDELLAAERAPVDPLLRELPLDDHLRRDAGVVGPGHPEHAVAAHPLPARQDVLDRSSVGVPDVEPPRHVRRRDHHHVTAANPAGRRAGSGRLSPSARTSAPRSCAGSKVLGRPSADSSGRLRATGSSEHQKRALGALSYIRTAPARPIRRPPPAP